jgi:hypothetical protein
MKPTLDIVAEPVGQTYIDLLNFAASRCQLFSLVWRDQFHFEQSAYDIKDHLKPFLISNDRTNEWPGTTLIGHEAIVRKYRVANESIKLLQISAGLYGWHEPRLPEDLAFYDFDNRTWLASISHDRQAWFFDESLSSAEIHAYVPDLKIKQHRD